MLGAQLLMVAFDLMRGSVSGYLLLKGMLAALDLHPVLDWAQFQVMRAAKMW